MARGQSTAPNFGAVKKPRIVTYRPHAADRAQSPMLVGIHLSAQQNAALDALDSVYTTRIKAILDSGAVSNDAQQRARTLYAEYARKSRAVLTADQRATFDNNRAKLQAAATSGASTHPTPAVSGGGR